MRDLAFAKVFCKDFLHKHFVPSAGLLCQHVTVIAVSNDSAFHQQLVSQLAETNLCEGSKYKRHLACHATISGGTLILLWKNGFCKMLPV